ncbi:DUF4873 domain-containing protein [Streptomyces sp. NPDC057302]|uniref:DUF4873 domain-containing protein n=1 Tax=Streptomyces sp. NPDC057302 TaxID=3346094 RepID=UPI003636C83C
MKRRRGRDGALLLAAACCAGLWARGRKETGSGTPPFRDVDSDSTDHGLGADEADGAYIGPAALLVEGRDIAVSVHLGGYFEPIDGSRRWYGRITESQEVSALSLGHRHGVALRIGDGAAASARLTERDPWGNVRITGVGLPPHGY